MKIVMYSNFLTHHQVPLAEAFQQIPGVEYIFVATTPYDQSRAAMGYKDENKSRDFVLCSYDSDQNERMAHHLAKEADIVIVGSAPDAYMRERLETGKITFHSSERYFKKGINLKTLPRYFASTMKHLWPYQKLPLYFLCSSAYTSKDVNTFTRFPDRCFRWGYFTEVKDLSEEQMQSGRVRNEKPVILWAGRFLSWKHPEVPLHIAHMLKNQCIEFDMRIIGDGELNSEMNNYITSNSLADCVHMLGFMSPEEVRKQMEQADVFLFTSDFNEGWGAVLNEAMSSGCVSVASHAIGATPFLIDDGNNGYIYKNGDEDQLFRIVKELIHNRSKCKKIGSAAYHDIYHLWSPRIAAERLIKLNESLIEDKGGKVYQTGPCSPAPILNNGWYGK